MMEEALEEKNHELRVAVIVYMKPESKKRLKEMAEKQNLTISKFALSLMNKGMK